MGQDDVLDDGQAQARASGLAGASLIYAVKALEDAVQVLGGNAGAKIPDGELYFGFQKPRADANSLAGLGILECVFDEVAENLVHGVGIGQDQDVKRANGFQLNAGIGRNAPQRVNAFLQQRTGLHGPKRQFVVRAFQARQGQQILGDPVHACGILQNDAKKLAAGFLARLKFLDQRFDISLNGSKRSAQLMADVGDELPACILRGLDASNVVQNSQRAARGHGNGIDLEDPPRSERPGPAGMRLALLQRRADTGQHLGIAHRMDQRPASANLRAGNALHGCVGPAHKPLGSNCDHRLLHRIKHGGQLLAAVPDLGKLLFRPLDGLVQRSLRSGKYIFFRVKDTGAQVALGDAPRKRNHSLQPRGEAARKPDSQRQRDSRRDQTGPQNLIPERKSASAGGQLQHFARKKRNEGKLHRRGLKDQQQEKKAEQPGEYF